MLATTIESLKTSVDGQPIGVAFSGGVDSAVCVALLQRAGAEVEAYHMLTCTAEVDSATVALAEALGVPLHVIDLRERFEAEVVAPFFDAYARGETPNPCVFCNPRLKFGALRQCIQGRMATGHYVGKGIEPISGVSTLCCANDKAKDQSYFLYAITPADLEQTLFPLAGATRSEVVALARAWALPIPEAKLSSGSQDICFLPGGDYRPELARRHPEVMCEGDILNPEGKVIGRHTGLANYTRGQRKGIGVATGGRVFVTALNWQANTLTLGPKEDLLKTQFKVAEMHWLVPPVFPLTCEAVSRYHHAPFKCVVFEDGTVQSETPQTLITPGQACVFYREKWVLGGGCIQF
ncbi:MAG: tRNA 2-thiouridine(34) synthase MnmA [bacterium]|nr:tRNA 2-thiouridine(34) synthase MnmA [bacterium]